jgi:hypothetical protein
MRARGAGSAREGRINPLQQRPKVRFADSRAGIRVTARAQPATEFAARTKASPAPK